MKKILLLLLILVQISCRKLIFVQNLFRHGARYPIFKKEQDFTKQSKIANNLGELTNQGKNMHYTLGKVLYKKYWKALFGGTSAQYVLDHKKILVKSTNINRTIESLESQLRGWLQNLKPLRLEPINLNYSLPAFQNLSDFLDLNYTNNTWNVFEQIPRFQTFPIHTGQKGFGAASVSPYDKEEFLLKFDTLNCPNQRKWILQNKRSPTGQQIINFPSVQQALIKLSQAFPSERVSFENAYEYVDNYDCMRSLGEPTLGIFSDKKYKKSFRYLKEITMFLTIFFRPFQYYITGTNLFENIVKNLKAAIDGSGPKLILYSAHDTTVGLVLATLNLTNVACINERYINGTNNSQICVSDYPPFASNLIIQLYQQANGNHTFDIVFNNVRRRIPFCNYQFSCSVERFYQWFEGWKVQDPNKQCGIKDQYQSQLVEMQKAAQISMGFSIAAFGIILVQTIWIVKNCQRKFQQGQQSKVLSQLKEVQQEQNREKGFHNNNQNISEANPNIKM